MWPPHDRLALVSIDSLTEASELAAHVVIMCVASCGSRHPVLGVFPQQHSALFSRRISHFSADGTFSTIKWNRVSVCHGGRSRSPSAKCAERTEWQIVQLCFHPTCWNPNSFLASLNSWWSLSRRWFGYVLAGNFELIFNPQLTYPQLSCADTFHMFCSFDLLNQDVPAQLLNMLHLYVGFVGWCVAHPQPVSGW